MHVKLTVARFGLGQRSTLGRLYIDGKPACYTLEDARRKVKVHGQTCVPEGTYDLRVREVGGFSARYAARFRDIHKGMIEVTNVPNFGDILVHMGNDHEDTSGCLLLGTSVLCTPEGEFIVLGSGKAYRAWYPAMIEGVLRGDAKIQYVVQGRVDVPVPG